MVLFVQNAEYSGCIVKYINVIVFLWTVVVDNYNYVVGFDCGCG